MKSKSRWSGVRAIRIHAGLTAAIVNRAERGCISSVERCDLPDCCGWIRNHMSVLGLAHPGETEPVNEFFGWDGSSDGRSSSRRDCRGMIRTIDSFGLMRKDNVLDGFMEVPEYVGKLLQDPHFAVLTNGGSWDSLDERREVACDFLYVLVAAAFPMKFPN